MSFYTFIVFKNPRAWAIGSLSHRVIAQGWFLTPLLLSEIGKPISSSSLAIVRSLFQVKV